MRKPEKVSSSLNHRWFYSYGKPLKFLSRGLYEKTHKGFISKPLKLSVLTIEIFAGKILVNCDIKMLAEQNLSKYCIVCGSYFSIFSLDFMTQAIIQKPVNWFAVHIIDWFLHLFRFFISFLCVQLFYRDDQTTRNNQFAIATLVPFPLRQLVGFRYGKKHFVKIVIVLVRVLLKLLLCSCICFIIRKKPLF